MKDILLTLQNITVHYGGVSALDGVNITVNEGEIVALMGPNGAGKSTILKTIFGMLEHTAGKILFHNTAIRPKPHKLIQRGIAYVPQGRQLFTSLTVRENLELGGVAIKYKDELEKRINKVLTIFPTLNSKLNMPAGSLSGGQQQMVAIARGLMINPVLLLLDEPTLGLSPKLAKEVFAQIASINNRHKTAIMIIEHNVRELLQVSHRAYVLSKGKVVIDEPDAKKLITKGDTRLEKVFLS